MPLAPGYQFTSTLTTGDSVGGYRMWGIRDGLGADDNGNGTFAVLMNHELSVPEHVERTSVAAPQAAAANQDRIATVF